MRYALIKDGIVVNIIIADHQFIQDELSNLNVDSAVSVEGIYVDIGFTYDGINFNPSGA